MSHFTILTDSCCDLPAQLVQELNISVLPLSFNLRGMTYWNHWDNREMEPQDFYEFLRKGEMATTSGVNVGQYQEQMEAILKRGRDILVLSFSSALSTSYQSAVVTGFIGPVIGAHAGPGTVAVFYLGSQR